MSMTVSGNPPKQVPNFTNMSAAEERQARMDELEQRISDVNDAALYDFAMLEKRIDALERRIDRLDGMLDGMGKGAESRIEAIEGRVSAIERKLNHKGVV